MAALTSRFCHQLGSLPSIGGVYFCQLPRMLKRRGSCASAHNMPHCVLTHTYVFFQRRFLPNVFQPATIPCIVKCRKVTMLCDHCPSCSCASIKRAVGMDGMLIMRFMTDSKYVLSAHLDGERVFCSYTHVSNVQYCVLFVNLLAIASSWQGQTTHSLMLG